MKNILVISILSLLVGCSTERTEIQQNNDATLQIIAVLSSRINRLEKELAKIKKKGKEVARHQRHQELKNSRNWGK